MEAEHQQHHEEDEEEEQGVEEAADEGGYTTGGGATEDDDDAADFFAEGLDVDHLLQVMAAGPESAAGGSGSGGVSESLQPFEILRRQRAAQQRLAEQQEEARERLASRPRRKAAHAARARSAAAAATIGGGGGDSEGGSDFSLGEEEEEEDEELVVGRGRPPRDDIYDDYAEGDEYDEAGEDEDEDEAEEEDDAAAGAGGRGCGWAAAGLEMGAEGDIKPKRKSKWRRRGGKGSSSGQVPEHISRMVGHANLLYASNKYQEAVQVLLEVIRSVPNLRDPYRTLGALHEVMGQPRQALNYFIIAAHMGRRQQQDTSLWHKLAVMSEEQGFLRQAIYCWNKVLSREKDDFDATLSRARLYAAIGEPWRARQTLSSLLSRTPGHPEVVKALAALYHDAGQPHKAVELLEGQLARHYSQADLTHINMLTDLYMGMGHYGDAVALINRSEVVMCQGDALPIDLRVRRGVCLAHIGQVSAAQQDIAALSDHPVVDEEAGETYLDLYLMVLQECIKAGQAAMAVPAMNALKDAPGVMDDPQQWQPLCDAYCAAGLREAATALVTDRLASMGKAHTRYMEFSLYLARLLVSCGDSAAAADVLARLDAEVDRHELSLPESQAEQLSLLLQKASLHLKLGQREAFASSLLPQFEGLVAQAENNAAVVTAAKKAAKSGRVPRDLVKALKRRKMFARKGGRRGEGGYETDSVFKGYVSRDRRKGAVAEADRAADQLLRRAAAAGTTPRKAGGATSGVDTEAEGDATDAEQLPSAAAAAGDADADLPAELSALVLAATTDQSELPDIFGDPQIFGAFTELVSVLMADGRSDEAASLLSRTTALANVRGGAVQGGWWGPSATTTPAPKRRQSGAAAAAAGALSEGDVSDWGGGGPAGAAGAAGAAAGVSASSSKDEMRALTDSLRLMAAQVSLTRGDTEEATKLLRALLTRWPCSWSAWSLYCSSCSQSGRLGSWLKHVAQLRSKHPDSLALQVLAAHADNLAGDQVAACGTYAAALQQLPDEPLLLLSLGCSLVDAALSSKGAAAGISSSSSGAGSGAGSADRNATLLRGFAALHSYARARGPAAEAEAAYNLGRAAHRIGLLHVAVAHYERVLQLADEAAAAGLDGTAQQMQGLSLQQQQQQQEQVGDVMQVDGEEGAAVAAAADAAAAPSSSQQQKQPPLPGGSEAPVAAAGLQQLGRGLAREAAHNLVLIYKGSGAQDLARHIMQQYLVI